MRFCLEGIKESLGKIQNAPVSEKPNDLECLIGLSLSKWSFVRIDNLIKDGLHEAIDSLQVDLNKLHDLIHKIYFINDKRFDIETL